jgi:hypothetical protein
LDDPKVRVLGEEPPGQAVVVGFIRRLLRVEGNKFTSWIELEGVMPERDKVGGRFLCLKRTAYLYIPLGWKGWTVARQVHLMPHPLKPTTHAIFNDRIKWVISDRWAHARQNQGEAEAEAEADGDDEFEFDEFEGTPDEDG